MDNNLAQEYLKKNNPIKIVTVPTGFKFKIKKLNPISLSRLSADIDLENLDENNVKGNLLLSIKMLKKAIIEPTITENESDENSLSIDDIDSGDLTFLIDEITSLASSEKKNGDIQKREINDKEEK